MNSQRLRESCLSVTHWTNMADYTQVWAGVKMVGYRRSTRDHDGHLPLLHNSNLIRPSRNSLCTVVGDEKRILNSHCPQMGKRDFGFDRNHHPRLERHRLRSEEH